MKAPDMLVQVLDLTLRDHFAAHALNGLVANQGWFDHVIKNKPGKLEQTMALHAYGLADAMLEARGDKR